MGSVHLTSPVETSTVYCVLSDRGVKICITMAASTNLKLFLLISVVAASSSSPSPLRLKRAPQREGTRLFAGNDAIDAGVITFTKCCFFLTSLCLSDFLLLLLLLPP